MNEVSMFKVGDKVVFINSVYSDCKEVLTIDFIGRFDLMLSNKDKGIELNEICGWSLIVRHATPEEIAAEYRNDKTPLMQHLEKCELETLRDCDTSPNCKKFDERVK